MNTVLKNNSDLYFLAGGGKMGELTRAKDWSQTTVGDPELWPQSLRTTVAMILSSKFPMFLWWGEDLIQFYNDAYRPSMGNDGKHPKALGQKGKECWPEIWDIIYPLITQVLTTGESTWSEDQLIPIYRNGHIEDVYWTFSYSPVTSETEKIEGVLVVCTETTEKVKNIKLLQESEHLVRSVIENAPFPIGVYKGKDMQIIIANQVIMDIWGKGYNVLGKSYKEILPELVNQEIFEQVESVLESGIAFHAKNQRVDLNINGALQAFYFNYSFTPLTDTSGKVYGVMNTAADVTDLHFAAATIQESENKLRNTILQAPIAMCIFRGPDHIVELANELMFELWGKPGEVFMNKPLFEGLFEARNQGFEELLDSVYQTGKTVSAKSIPVNLPRNNKMELLYVDILYQAYRDTDGVITGILAIAIDVTAQVMSRMKIEEAEEKARLAIRSAELGVYETNLATDEMITDSRFKEIWGFDYDAQRWEYAKAIHPYDLPTRNKAHETALITGQLEYSARVIWKDRSEHWVRVTGKVMFDEKNVPVKLIGIIQDITAPVIAQKKIEELVAERTRELASANSDLQKSNAELAQFAYIASHDLQEPLRKITTFSQMLENSLGQSISDQSANYLSKIKNSSSRMNKLIRDVLTYSELVKDTEIFTDVDLALVVENIVSDFDLLLEEKKAEIIYYDLPVIQGIPHQMSQLFRNLIGNALKFSRRDIKPVIKITATVLSNDEITHLALQPNTGYINIRIADNGIGFKKEYAEQIFNIFQRLHRKSEYEGTGIGLAMCKKIVINHKGEINAVGSSESGAVFNVILPLTRIDA
jgi:signal transduction histidine kinase